MTSEPVELKDGSLVVIRPATDDDIEATWHFLRDLPEQDRNYLRIDVTQRGLVERRYRTGPTGSVQRLVACDGDQIAGLGALETEPAGWKSHVGELRIIVAPRYRRRGLGMILTRELYRIAAHDGLQELVVKLMAPQESARSIMKRLGFRDQMTLPGYVTDRSGHRQDLIICRCDLAAMWRELEHYMTETDWQRTR